MFVQKQKPPQAQKKLPISSKVITKIDEEQKEHIDENF